MKNSLKAKFFHALTITLVTICFSIFIFKSLFINVTVYGHSMNPSIEDGSKGYMLKVNKNTSINRFDVVISLYDNVEEKHIIKRVIGLPNEKIKLTNNILFVNGELVNQNFEFVKSNSDYLVNEWTLNDNEYLLLGDNRNLTILPLIVSKDKIIAKNGFSYLTYDTSSTSCSNDYSTCKIKYIDFYLYRNVKGDK